MPQVAELTPESTVDLLLLPLRGATGFRRLRAFDLQRLTREHAAMRKALEDGEGDNVAVGAEPPPPPEPAMGVRPGLEERFEREEQLTMLGGALSRYADAHQALPPLDSVRAVQAALRPYLGGLGDELWLQWGNGQPLRLNAALSEALLADIALPAETVVIYEGEPQPDGSRWVVGAEGNPWRVPADEWEAVRQRSKLL